MADLHGRCALVTGASSGLGVDFARELARRGARLVLVARREPRLRALADELAKETGVEVRVEAVDLADPGAREALADRLAAERVEVDVLVNNAGFGVYGPFLDIPWERERQMLELDVAAVVHLTKLFAQGMVARGRGWILQVASIGAYQPSPTYASYSAAKAFVLSFGEALSFELRHTGVKVTVVSPGVTATEFLRVSGQSPSLYQRLAMMRSADVARAGVRAMLKGRPSVVPGLVNKVPAFLMRLTPRRLQARIAHLSMTMG
ncbi:MAG TPA: SDR family oxidoreductase [Myxococcota bacterium]|nr:SDR family oxidoreductase [Myxococcota bacterium]